MTPLAAVPGPHIDYAGLSPFIALTVGALVVLLLGLLRAPAARRQGVPATTLLTLAVTLGLVIWRWTHHGRILSGALAVDDLALALDVLFIVAAAAAVVLSWRGLAVREAGHGEYHTLLLFTVLGMAILVAAENTVTLFIGLELLSICLYIMCATELRRERSLESGLKYLVVGSLGSATLVYGLALIYGATGSTDFSATGAAIANAGIVHDPLLLAGIALVVVGLAFKASVAPFHQWTPDVYEGAPTPVTAFMAVATKAAALGVFLRFFDEALIGAQVDWAPILAALATITIIVGNVGALGQSSLKRLLAYSSVAQAGYMLGGVVVGTQLGVRATVLYLAVYLAMNLAAFAVIVARERETGEGDDIDALAGLGASRPLLAWPMTIAMLSLAGIPATAGFVGKFYLISALVDGQYTWLGVVIVVGSMISLAYYLKVVAAMWLREAPARTALVPAGAGAAGARPAMAGGSPEADAGLAVDGAGDGDGDEAAAPARPDRQVEITAVAVLFGAASLGFGIFPSPLFRFVEHVGSAIGGLF